MSRPGPKVAKAVESALADQWRTFPELMDIIDAKFEPSTIRNVLFHMSRAGLIESRPHHRDWRSLVEYRLVQAND